mmetsp:Transcript_2004/g.3756  ORF Transcript_2004/g.3756 Transcript_2004/m.3756 type:complete len:122 (+) Transcript_2004:224-589(+)|eukprot:CAMPEP_0183728534 /NCGR_PEP_ID=MMETSP0737-20130205/28281_1 /TAXON_ID=385413 /ORGANISM="Thalassiosira miniscula, Strain CCMP1093" /LENGTH=121 /DNA_ID=CAMNT_0025960499 /DNA_START=94 /DNA_END=459 /DNA_ORIENTATION=-
MTFTLFDSENDFSFANRARRRINTLCFHPINQGDTIERASFIVQDINECDDDSKNAQSSDDASSVGSCRLVTFAEDVVTEIIPVPRYEEESMGELFYSTLDEERFKCEARLEWVHDIQVIW